MDGCRSYSVWGISLTALTSLIVGVTALGIVFFLLNLFLNNLNRVALASGTATISQYHLQMIVTWQGISLSVAAIFATMLIISYLRVLASALGLT